MINYFPKLRKDLQLKRQMGYPNQNWNTGQRTHSYISSVNFQDN